MANGHANGHYLNGFVKEASTQPEDERTDYSKWRLLDERGRQTWHYLESEEEIEEWPQSVADKHHLGLPTVLLLRDLKKTLLIALRIYPLCHQR